MKNIIVLAYSGGFRSTVAIPWLADRHGADVVAVTLDLGQATDLGEIRDRALAAGAVRAHVIDARDEFARDYVWPTLKADALSEGRYPMATAIARPLIAKKLLELAHIEGTAVVAHGSTGRDRTRLDRPLRSLDRALRPIACAEGLTTAQIAEYADRLGLPVPGTSMDRVDDNLWGRTIGRPVDDASQEAPASSFKLSRGLSQAPDAPAVVEIAFERGAPTGINGVVMPPAELIESLSTIAGEHGIGRFDRVKNRADGTRSRVLYEAPAAAVLHQARRELDRLGSSESLNRFSPAIATAYAEVVGRGEWFDRLRLGLDAFVSATQGGVTGSVRVKLFKGQGHVVGRTLNPVEPV